MSNEPNKKDGLQEHAENLVYAMFKITIPLAFGRPQDAWNAAVTMAEKAVDEKIASVNHQKALFGTALGLSSVQAEIGSTDKAVSLLDQWCDDHLANLYKQKAFVTDMRKLKATVQVTHIKADGTVTKKEIG